MQFGPDAVAHVLGMLSPGPLRPGETASLAAMTGSWPELLAHLLLRRDTFKDWPEFHAEIGRQAAAHAGGPASRRAARDDLLLMDRTAEELELALAALIEAEAARVEVADRVGSAWHAYVGARRAEEADLPLRIAAERRP